VVAVTLGGPHAGGPVRADSSWGFGLYYGDVVRADDVRALGFEGTVVEPGSWGRLANGGARLTVEGQGVDLLYRDLDDVRQWLEEAQAGRYEVDQVQGNLAGMASYVLAGGARAGGGAGGRAAATGVSRHASTGRAEAVSWGVMGGPPWPTPISLSSMACDARG
jgi:hypothetical protein